MCDIMVDFGKLIQENEVIRQDADKHLANLKAFEKWLRDCGGIRVYEYVERNFDNVVVVKRDESELIPKVEIRLPRWW